MNTEAMTTCEPTQAGLVQRLWDALEYTQALSDAAPYESRLTYKVVLVALHSCLIVVGEVSRLQPKTEDQENAQA